MGVPMPKHMESRTAGDQKKWAHVADAVAGVFGELGTKTCERLATAAANTALSEKRASGPAFGDFNSRLDNLARCRKDRTMKDAADIVASEQVMRHLLTGFCDVQDDFYASFPFNFETTRAAVETHKRAQRTRPQADVPLVPGAIGNQSARILDHLRAKSHDAWDLYDSLSVNTLRLLAESLERAVVVGTETRKRIGTFDVYPELAVFAPLLSSDSDVVKAVQDSESWLDDLHLICERIEDVVFPLYEDVLTLADTEDEDASPDESRDEFSFTMKVLKSDGERKRVIMGVALVPDEVDLQDDIISAEEVERAAHQFMLNKGVIGIMHEEFPTGASSVVESFIAPHDMILGTDTVSKGSWVLGVKVFDDGLLKRIEEGEFTGFSIGGYAASAREIG